MGDLAQEARADARAFRENTVYTADGAPVRLIANSDRLDAYADRIEALEACLGDDLTAVYMAGLKESEARIADERVDAARAMQNVCDLAVYGKTDYSAQLAIRALDPEQFREKK